jgi:hypothetical protein
VFVDTRASAFRVQTDRSAHAHGRIDRRYTDSLRARGSYRTTTDRTETPLQLKFVRETMKAKKEYEERMAEREETS